MQRLLPFLLGLSLGLLCAAFSVSGATDGATDGAHDSEECVAEFVERMKAEARQAAWIGFSFKHTANHVGRFRVTYIHAGSPVELAGIEVGDYVTGIDGKDFNRTDIFQAQSEFEAAVGQLREGTGATFRVSREEKVLEVEVVPRPHIGPSLWKFIGQKAVIVHQRIRG